MRKVIVNSTPLIALSNIGRLNLLKDLYKEIDIPQAVYDEVTAKQDSACNQIKDNVSWIHVRSIVNDSDKKMYQAKLHAGEIEVMILGQQAPKADLLIIDDNAAKKTAKYLGFKVTGTLGVLLRAKREGLIASVAAEIKSLLENGFYVSAPVQKMALSAAEEF